ncbi:SGNH hydrolase-type esterase domain-containing protein [Fusarium acuminatum]|uniref:SGNH hydrolase-type esterase domain-containing protein n=1 Tax=Fusarium acuminatum TaxID=5515 RepID=A0ABZ2WNF8_9HYPO
MKFSLSLAALAAGAFQVVAGQTVYFAGDSTMAKNGANDGVTDGWGNYIGKYLKVTAVNKAIGGRSARSYTNEGRFQEIIDVVKKGDIVVIEFGHNDGGSPTKNDNKRSDCPGSGTEVCISDVTGEKVYTFVFYVSQAAKALVAKGATVILSSQTPNNQWETGTFEPGAPRFVGYVPIAAKALASSSVTYVDHFAAVTNMYKKLGSSKVNSLYPKDHTHTSPEAADLIAKAFVQAIEQELNGKTSLKPHIKTPITTVY